MTKALKLMKKPKPKPEGFIEKRKVYRLGNEWLYFIIAQRYYEMEKGEWRGLMLMLGSVKFFHFQLIFKIF
jgi:hypothetical protein